MTDLISTYVIRSLLARGSSEAHPLPKPPQRIPTTLKEYPLEADVSFPTTPAYIAPSHTIEATGVTSEMRRRAYACARAGLVAASLYNCAADPSSSLTQAEANETRDQLKDNLLWIESAMQNNLVVGSQVMMFISISHVSIYNLLLLPFNCNYSMEPTTARVISCLPSQTSFIPRIKHYLFSLIIYLLSNRHVFCMLMPKLVVPLLHPSLLRSLMVSYVGLLCSLVIIMMSQALTHPSVKQLILWMVCTLSHALFTTTLDIATMLIHSRLHYPLINHCCPRFFLIVPFSCSSPSTSSFSFPT